MFAIFQIEDHFIDTVQHISVDLTVGKNVLIASFTVFEFLS